MNDTIEMHKLFSGSMVQELNGCLHFMKERLDQAKSKLQAKDLMSKQLIDDCERVSGNSISILRNYSMFLQGDGIFQEKKIINVIDVACRSAKMFLSDKDIVFLLGKDNKSEQVLGDETQIYQLFYNLMKIAKEALPNKRGTVWMDITREYVDADNPDSLLPGEYIRTMLSYNGFEIDGGNIENILSSCFSSNKIEICLGLSVSLEIVRRHKGSLRIASDAFSGITCTILLPSCMSRCEDGSK